MVGVRGEVGGPRTGLQVRRSRVVASRVHVARAVGGHGHAHFGARCPTDGKRPLAHPGRVELDGVRVEVGAAELDGARPWVPVAGRSLLVAGGVHVARRRVHAHELVVAVGTEVLRPLEIPHRAELRDPRILAALAVPVVAGVAADHHRAGTRVVVASYVLGVVYPSADVDVVAGPVDHHVKYHVVVVTTPRLGPLQGAARTAELGQEGILVTSRRPVVSGCGLPVDVSRIVEGAAYVDACPAEVDTCCLVVPGATEGLAERDAIRRRRRGSRRRSADQGHVGVPAARRCDVRLAGEVHGPLELAGNSQVGAGIIQGAVEDLVVAVSVEQHVPQQVARRAVLRDYRRVRPCHCHVGRRRRIWIDVSRPPEVATRVDVASGVHLGGCHLPAVVAVGMDRHCPL